jgi:hypothetical protein
LTANVMSSIMRRSSSHRQGEKTSKGASKRSSTSYADERARVPRINLKYGTSARDQIAFTIAEEILKDPAVDTGKLLSTIEASNSVLNVSDATLLVSSAVLSNIGAIKQAESVLSKSATVSRMFKRFQLDDPMILKDFTTLIFTLSSGIRKTVEAAVISSLKIRAETTTAGEDSPVVINTFARLAQEGTITIKEAKESVVSALMLPSEEGLRARIKSAVSSATRSVAPSDSISRVASSSSSSPDSPKLSGESDLREFAKRRRSGVEPEFEQIFRRVAPPVAVTIPSQATRAGLGYIAKPNSGFDMSAMITDMNSAFTNLSARNTMNDRDRLKLDTTPIIGRTPVSPDVFEYVADESSEAVWTSEMKNPSAPLPSGFTGSTASSATVTNKNQNHLGAQSSALNDLLAAFSDSDSD